MIIKLREGVFYDLDSEDFIIVENNNVVERKKLNEVLNLTTPVGGSSFSEYGHYGENNPPLPFTPVAERASDQGDKEYDV